MDYSHEDEGVNTKKHRYREASGVAGNNVRIYVSYDSDQLAKHFLHWAKVILFPTLAKLLNLIFRDVLVE